MLFIVHDSFGFRRTLFNQKSRCYQQLSFRSPLSSRRARFYFRLGWPLLYVPREHYGPHGRRSERRAVRYLQGSNDCSVRSLLCVSLKPLRHLCLTTRTLPATWLAPAGRGRTRHHQPELTVRSRRCGGHQPGSISSGGTAH